MAENGHILLREARDLRAMTREQLGWHVGVSHDTIRRWETGESQPTSSDVDRMGEVLRDATLWHRWMLATDPPYARRYGGGAEALALPASFMRVRYAIEDVQTYQNAMERDALDGKLDDPKMKAAYSDCVRAAIASLSEAAQHL